MSDNPTFWEVFRTNPSPESKKIRSKRNIITARFAKIRYETKGEALFSVEKRIFLNWSREDVGFKESYEKYDESGDKKDVPVIELKDKRKGYDLENMRWVCQRDKGRKNGKMVSVINGDKTEIVFSSARRAEIELKLPRGVLSRAVRTLGKYKDFQIDFHKD